MLYLKIPVFINTCLTFLDKNAVVDYKLQENEFFEIYDPYTANAQFLLSKRQNLELRTKKKLG